jgi:hypothetical protein
MVYSIYRNAIRARRHILAANAARNAFTEVRGAIVEGMELMPMYMSGGD